MTLCVCVVLSSIVQSSVVPQTDRPNASTAPWRFGWPLQILVKDDQCREDFMQKKKRPVRDTSGWYWRQRRQKLYFLQHLLSSTPTSECITWSVQRYSTQAQEEAKYLFKNTPKAGRYSSLTFSRNLIRLPQCSPHSWCIQGQLSISQTFKPSKLHSN